MDKNNSGISEGNLVAIGIATLLLLSLIDINLAGTLERVLYFFGIPVATGYIFSVIGKDLDEEKDQAVANAMIYVIGALIIALFINGSIHEKKTMDACSEGNQDACEALEYSREQREDYRE